jgi:glycosyltransferase involved in cell wall biosynthesis
LRILHCISGMSVGGAERQLSLLAPAQVGSGIEAHVALLNGGAHLDRLTAGRVEMHHVNASSNHDPRIATALRAVARKVRPDVIQTWLPQMDIFGGIAAKSQSIPWLLSERSTAAAYRDRAKDRVVRARLGATADAIVANSNAGALYWANRAKGNILLAVIPNAIPLGEIDAATAALPVEAMNDGFLLVIGRLSAEKNLGTLMSALRIVEDICHVQTMICGDGPMRDELGGAISALGLENSVFLLGNRDDVWNLMKSAAAVVSPSEFEGNPNVVLEAAAARCPLILSDIPAHRAIVEDDGAEFFAPSSARSLAQAIINRLGDDGLAKRKTEVARRVAEGLTIGSAVRGYRRVYHQLVKN